MKCPMCESGTYCPYHDGEPESFEDPVEEVSVHVPYNTEPAPEGVSHYQSFGEATSAASAAEVLSFNWILRAFHDANGERWWELNLYGS